MRWIKVNKEAAIQPTSGTYKAWKEQIAKEGRHQCVYCAIHEALFGGVRNFHIEHYKPKSIFKQLENDIKNLFYSCPVCNTFKGDAWPDDPKDDHSNSSFPDPSKVDYNELFEVDFSSGLLKGKFSASTYMIESLNLNRPQLILERKTFAAFQKVRSVADSRNDVLLLLSKIQDHAKRDYFFNRLVQIYGKLIELSIELRRLRPYESDDLARQ
jgi:hypothetical protein